MARYKFCFWLNGDKDDELLVAETVDELKAHRSFSAVVRDGIMIVKELKEGRVDLLLKLYPFVKDAVAAMLPPPVPPTPPPMDIATLMREFERMMDERGRGATIPDTRESGFPAMSPAYKQPGIGLTAGAGSTLGAGRKLSLPVLDDDDDGDTLQVIKHIVTPEEIAANFREGMASLGLGF